ncbi:unnamed protein product [Phytophthora fragariaefolia]|uniref:Unnamed protein product n=1 Tax=Phytophthora fragariaefolia TaxID=1490495 RepID=A0A9W7CIM6_9STRA|nr:unnamed protein product [Phytophthora fragariaefolia]
MAAPVKAQDSIEPKPEQEGNLDKKNNQSKDNNALPDEDDSKLTSTYSDLPRIAWEWIRWSGAMTFVGMDFAGEVLANFLGLTQSKYQWILDAQEREEEERQQRRLEKRQRRQLRLEQLLQAEQRKLQELETGTLQQDEAISEEPSTM